MKKTVIVEILVKEVDMSKEEAAEAWKESEIVLDESHFNGEFFLTEEKYLKLLKYLEANG